MDVLVCCSPGCKMDGGSSSACGAERDGYKASCPDVSPHLSTCPMSPQYLLQVDQVVGEAGGLQQGLHLGQGLLPLLRALPAHGSLCKVGTVPGLLPHCHIPRDRVTAPQPWHSAEDTVLGVGLGMRQGTGSGAGMGMGPGWKGNKAGMGSEAGNWQQDREWAAGHGAGIGQLDRSREWGWNGQLDTEQGMGWQWAVGHGAGNGELDMEQGMGWE